MTVVLVHTRTDKHTLIVIQATLTGYIAFRSHKFIIKISHVSHKAFP